MATRIIEICLTDTADERTLHRTHMHDLYPWDQKGLLKIIWLTCPRTKFAIVYSLLKARTSSVSPKCLDRKGKKCISKRNRGWSKLTSHIHVEASKRLHISSMNYRIGSWEILLRRSSPCSSDFHRNRSVLDGQKIIITETNGINEITSLTTSIWNSSRLLYP